MISESDSGSLLSGLRHDIYRERSCGWLDCNHEQFEASGLDNTLEFKSFSLGDLDLNVYQIMKLNME